MSFLSKIWEWLKKNWKWVLFPIGLMSLLISLWPKLRSIPIDLEVSELEQAERRKMMEISQANELRDAKLKELADAHQERLASLTRDQERELEDLTERPIEEVVKWFDKL